MVAHSTVIVKKICAARQLCVVQILFIRTNMDKGLIKINGVLFNHQLTLSSGSNPLMPVSRQGYRACAVRQASYSKTRQTACI